MRLELQVQALADRNLEFRWLIKAPNRRGAVVRIRLTHLMSREDMTPLSTKDKAKSTSSCRAPNNRSPLFRIRKAKLLYKILILRSILRVIWLLRQKSIPVRTQMPFSKYLLTKATIRIITRIKEASSKIILTLSMFWKIKVIHMIKCKEETAVTNRKSWETPKRIRHRLCWLTTILETWNISPIRAKLTPQLTVNITVSWRWWTKKDKLRKNTSCKPNHLKSHN